MIDERLLEKLSAYADGELPAAERAAVAQAVAERPELSRRLKFFEALSAAARALPVPSVDAQLAARWSPLAERTTKLSKSAIRKLEAAARALPVPAVSEATYAEMWERILERTVETALPNFEAVPAAPSLKEEKWAPVWEKIKRETHLIDAKKAQAVLNAPPEAPAEKTEKKAIPADFKPRRRSWVGVAVAAGLAAAAAVAVMLTPRPDATKQKEIANPTQDEPVLQLASVMQAPRATDDRYRMQLKYVDGQAQPVVCFYLKDGTVDATDEGDGPRWFPD